MQPLPIIHLVDDDESFQVAISRLLRVSGYAVENYTSVGSFLLASFDESPACLLLDVRMPGFNGLDLQEALSLRNDIPPIVFLTGYGDVPSSVRAMKAGAIDFLTKPVKREMLLAAIQSALAHQAKQHFFHEQLRKWRACHATLTTRELEVFNRVIAGKMNKVIAGELNAAERTVKAHRAQVMRKMCASSLAELVHIADQLAAGQISPANARPSRSAQLRA